MTETSGSNNPRAQRGSHASQPVGKTNNPRLSQPVGASNNPRHSQPVGASRSQPVGPQSSQPLNSVNVPANVVPVLPEGNPYSRAAAGGDYAQDRRRKKRKRIALGALAAVLVLALGGVGMAFAYINQIESNFSEDITPEVQEALEKPADYDGGTFYMLLMGTDKSKEREKGEYAGDTFRSDSMILTRVDPENKKVTMVSLHRDTETEIEGYGMQKLNASYAFGGPAGAIKAVSQMAGVPISHYAEINFDGFKDVVDALGGIEVDVPMEIDDKRAGGHVDAGKQTLNGDQALILCRARHAYDEYGDGDRYRAANQRLVLGAIAKKILSSDVATMASTIEALSQYVTTDFKIADILALANSLQGLDPSKDIYSAMEPTISEYRNETWYEQLDVEAWNTMMNRVKQGLPPTETDQVDELNGTVLASAGDGSGGTSDQETGVQAADGTSTTGKTFGETRTGIVTIKNGNGVNGVGAEALERIKPLGYTADASNANSFSYDETVVVFDTTDQRAYAEELIDALGCGRAVQNKNGEYVYEGDFLILIGSDWK
ncbi:LCP family protein [Adlercreutzia caecimuris]|jgi:LCP family protein required for cell wall assembly|uniref:LCP family protein n=1 Tax=Adlercreutzia caecimuris TaxID=671266 RepID=UPI001C3E5F17|nr:LCP family protein [Adlercreutzia caecimuris]MCI9673437.1 LCP family protein [Enterorhabdus sp.]